MSPTIVSKNGQVYLVLGASGGSRIITSTLQVLHSLARSLTRSHANERTRLKSVRHQALLGVVAYKQDVWKAVSSPRLHNQLLPPFVYTEAAFSPAITAYLKKLGHDVTPPPPPPSLLSLPHHLNDGTSPRPQLTLALVVRGVWRV
jgi:gamma-glutamyltranspeptidase